jgi:hypothetical protein
MNRPHLLAPLLALLVTACAGAASTAAPPAPDAYDANAVLALQRAWWRAYILADTAYLQAHTTPEFWLTLSSGHTFDRAAMLAQAAQNVNGSRLSVAWSDEAVRVAAPSVAVVTSRAAETEGPTTVNFRYLTVLEHGPAGWKVSLGQTTREAQYTPNAAAGVAGPLADYAGEYRTPRGGVLRVVVRDSALALIEPSGRELRMEPIGPALFEFRELSPLNGIVRFSFARDAGGRVTSFNRLATGVVNTFPRVDP